MADRDLAVLLGAGASVDADLPTAEGMVDKLLDDFRSRSDMHVMHDPQRRLLAFIVHGLRQDAEIRGDPIAVDVETVFDAIETLASRTRLSITPFISSWNPLVAQAERTRNAYETHEANLAAMLNRAIRSSPLRDQSRGTATSEQLEFVRGLLGSGSSAGSAFRHLANEVLRALVRILHLTDPGKTAYLKPLIDLCLYQRHLDIATLNYDLTIETVGQQTETDPDTGMDQFHLKRRVEFNSSFRLFKLHGSIDWQGGKQWPKPGEPFLSFDAVERLRDKPPDIPELIFGPGNKLRADGPYLELLRLFESSIELHTALLVVGYSFRDDHVNAMLRKWINGNASRHMVILDPAADALRRRGQLSGELRLGTELAVLAVDHPARVTLIAKTAAMALADAIRAARGY